jgi:hypothetical protein
MVLDDLLGLYITPSGCAWRLYNKLIKCQNEQRVHPPWGLGSGGRVGAVDRRVGYAPRFLFLMNLTATPRTRTPNL